jgi:hypothetical protein
MRIVTLKPARRWYIQVRAASDSLAGPGRLGGIEPDAGAGSQSVRQPHVSICCPLKIGFVSGPGPSKSTLPPPI